MNKFFNEISESWAIGDDENVVARELGITVEEVRKVYSYQDRELQKYFDEQSNAPMPPEDEDYFAQVNK
jgi:hypothetical protein